MSYIPPYSYFYNNGANPYTEGKVLPIGAPRKVNSFWRSYGFMGIALGGLLAILGLAMIPIEVSRIISGSINRLTTGSYLLYPNYNVLLNAGTSQVKSFIPDVISNSADNLFVKGIIGGNSLSTNSLANNYPIQDKYLWPWSHAALLFSLVTLAAGIVGILSGFRRTYTSIFAFFALSLISGFLAIFLVAYYGTQVYWQLFHNNNYRLIYSFHNLDYALGATMLSLSCAVCLSSFIAALCAGMSAGVCFGSKAPLLVQPKQQRAPKNNKNQQPQQPQQPQGYYAQPVYAQPRPY